MLCRYIFVLSVLLSALLAQASTTDGPVVIISDIDDTIKVTHVRGYSLFAHALNSTTPFAGMASLYQLIMNENSGSKIFYLSNAPESIAGYEVFFNAHMDLLKKNHFPDGELILRDSILDVNHKNKSIREIVNLTHPKKVIMIGDNGEYDNQVYKTAQLELNQMGIASEVYIHQLYSEQAFVEVGKPLLPNQVGFVTPIEIAMDLYYKSQLSRASFLWVLTNTGSFIYEEPVFFKSDFNSPLTFPSFKDCQDFNWIWPLQLTEFNSKVKEPLSVSEFKLLQEFQFFLNKRCR